MAEAGSRFPATVELTAAALTLALLTGVDAGTLSATWRGSFIDHARPSPFLAGISIPIFWLGLVLIWLFAVQLPWLPPDGRLSAEMRYPRSPISSSWMPCCNAGATWLLMPCAT